MAAHHLAFVVTDRDARIQPSQRQLIRRHCMQEKNKKPDSRRSKRDARRAAAPSVTVAAESTTNPWSCENRSSTDGGATELRIHEKRPRGQNHQLICQKPSVKGWDDNSVAIPASPPSDWVVFPFAAKLDTRSHNLLNKCALYTFPSLFYISATFRLTGMVLKTSSKTPSEIHCSRFITLAYRSTLNLTRYGAIGCWYPRS
jgi:hypothetical protein